MTNLCKTQYDEDPEEADDDTNDENARISYDTIPHHGAVNRIRVYSLFLFFIYSVFLEDLKLLVSGLIKVLSVFTILLLSFLL